ncbi:MAG: HAMP domain-containing histidine kinase [Gemmatimonadetes bacterium]|nr:HAMP domain-containing histidine kinase [Gemmatimonadota bacterium]
MEDIRGDTETLVRVYSLGVQGLAGEDPGDRAAEVLFEEVVKGFPYPVIATDAFGEPLFFRNLDLGIRRELPPWSEEDLHRLREAVRRMDRRTPPIEISGARGRVIQLIHYQESGTITLLRYLPWIQAAGFVLVGLFAFWAIRYNLRVTQGQIYVAMARESAHQMGTPLSSLYGWIALLGAGEDAGLDPPERAMPAPEVAAAMEQDVDRLTKVANRFELIGRRPKLEPLDLGDVLGDLRQYFEARLPRLGHRVEISLEMDEAPPLLGNRVLLEWAFENLVKNAVDALSGRAGHIRIELDHDPGTREARVLVRDDGGGIPRALRRKIFQTGVTTKTSGWGVGLALAKRIIEDYHGGRLELVDSEVGRGTTVGATLPVLPGRREQGQGNEWGGSPQPSGPTRG